MIDTVRRSKQEKQTGDYKQSEYGDGLMSNPKDVFKERHDKSTQKIYTCGVCRNTFTNWNSYQCHLDKKHTKQK